MKRIIKVHKNHFWKFFNTLPRKAKEKIEYVFEIIISNRQIPRKFFKHIEEGIYEIRIVNDGNSYRIFCIFDNQNLVIILHGFHKKTRKLPRNEILKAKRLRKEYFNEK